MDQIDPFRNPLLLNYPTDPTEDITGRDTHRRVILSREPTAQIAIPRSSNLPLLMTDPSSTSVFGDTSARLLDRSRVTCSSGPRYAVLEKPSPAFPNTATGVPWPISDRMMPHGHRSQHGSLVSKTKTFADGLRRQVT
jgi:hypothetical protein